MSGFSGLIFGGCVAPNPIYADNRVLDLTGLISSCVAKEKEKEYSQFPTVTLCSLAIDLSHQGRFDGVSPFLLIIKLHFLCTG